jgi:hypothetical protein
MAKREPRQEPATGSGKEAADLIDPLAGVGQGKTDSGKRDTGKKGASTSSNKQPKNK